MTCKLTFITIPPLIAWRRECNQLTPAKFHPAAEELSTNMARKNSGSRVASQISFQSTWICVAVAMERISFPIVSAIDGRKASS